MKLEIFKLLPPTDDRVARLSLMPEDGGLESERGVMVVLTNPDGTRVSAGRLVAFRVENDKLVCGLFDNPTSNYVSVDKTTDKIKVIP